MRAALRNTRPPVTARVARAAAESRHPSAPAYRRAILAVLPTLRTGVPPRHPPIRCQTRVRRPSRWTPVPGCASGAQIGRVLPVRLSLRPTQLSGVWREKQRRVPRRVEVRLSAPSPFYAADTALRQGRERSQTDAAAARPPLHPPVTGNRHRRRGQLTIGSPAEQPGGAW